MNADIDLTYHSTPGLWVATKKDQCGCEDCAGKYPWGMGRTKEEAVADYRERAEELTRPTPVKVSLAHIHDCDCNTIPHRRDCAIRKP
jgi:hypothetical protein